MQMNRHKNTLLDSSSVDRGFSNTIVPRLYKTNNPKTNIYSVGKNEVIMEEAPSQGS